MDKIALVSCVGKKQPYPCAAKGLYQSTWFIKAKAYVEKHYSIWFILSAQYGLVEPSDVISPYNKTLKSISSGARKEWTQNVFFFTRLKDCPITPVKSIFLLKIRTVKILP